jgi:hypothetical protein
MKDRLIPQFIEVNSNEESLLEKNLRELRSDRKFDDKPYKKEKTPVNAFLIYYQESLKELKATHSKVLGSELVKIASSKWSELS